MSIGIQIPAFGDPHWKAPVATSSDLPSTGNTTGDARIATTDQSIWVWDGSAWQQASGGGGSNAFGIIQTPAGTSPTADAPSDTLTYTSSDTSLTITGNATTDTVDFKVAVAEYNAGNSSTAITIDWSNGVAQKVAMTGNCTFTLSNPVTGTAYILRLAQDGTGSRTYTWPAAVKWPGGSAPTGSGASKVDLINLYWDGTSYYGSSALNY